MSTKPTLDDLSSSAEDIANQLDAARDLIGQMIGNSALHSKKMYLAVSLEALIERVGTQQRCLATGLCDLERAAKASPTVAAPIIGTIPDDRKWPEAVFHEFTTVKDHELGDIYQASLGLSAILDLLHQSPPPEDGEPGSLDRFTSGRLLSAASACVNSIADILHNLETERRQPAQVRS